MYMGERCQPQLHTIASEDVNRGMSHVKLFCVTQEIVTLASTGRANEGGYIRVERKEK
jgi:hypothetical protein